ncbi:cytochrome C [Sulfurimonas sp.]|uniref:cytochrome C n=1 Tax=Sulfurimonas sp. TaxID=2022749 RepID=UPI0025F8CC57|nr:cytochrome C [Sulfurimonas sp.]
MKKMILALVASSVLALANETTVNATMSLMTQGMNQIQAGFLYSNKEDISSGIKVVENANAIFANVDVSTFIKHNNKIQVTHNINKNVTENIKALKKAIAVENYSDATREYGELTANCIACHKIVRGW